MATTIFYLVIMVSWNESAFTLWRAMERH